MSKKEELKNKVESVKKELGTETMSSIFNLNTNQVYQKEQAPENRDGVALWGAKKTKK